MVENLAYVIEIREFSFFFVTAMSRMDANFGLHAKSFKMNYFGINFQLPTLRVVHPRH